MRTLSILLPLALVACTRLGGVPTDSPVPGDGSLDGVAHATGVDDATDLDHDEDVDTDVIPAPARRAGFHWDASRGALALSSSLASVPVEEGRTAAWVDRRAGGRAAAGGRRMLAPTRSIPHGPVEERAIAMDEGMVVGSGGLGTRGSGLGGGGSADAVGMLGDLSAEAPTATASRADTRHRVAAQAPARLKAGSTDDNADLAAFLDFVAGWKDRPGVAGNHVHMDVSHRRFVEVVDRGGDPVPGARIAIVDRAEDRVAWNGTTYGDGKAPFYPRLDGDTSADGTGDWLVQAEYQGEVVSARWDGRTETVRLDLPTYADDRVVALDVVFVIDTTGSMSDEIARIKQTLLSLTERVRGLQQRVDLRYGAVLYRDVGDEYLTRHTPLTADVQAFDALLQGIHAGGGGDGPESLNQGLSVAVGAMDWRPGAARMAFLVADAPPHMDYQDDTTYADASRAALTHGIRIHTVAASGLDDFGSLVFRQTAQLTRGQFIFIEYGSTAASAADHGVTGPVASNNLDDILYRQIEAEVVGWGHSRS
jgi:Mg-chelatase subunit ChlD